MNKIQEFLYLNSETYRRYEECEKDKLNDKNAPCNFLFSHINKYNFNSIMNLKTKNIISKSEENNYLVTHEEAEKVEEILEQEKFRFLYKNEKECYCKLKLNKDEEYETGNLICYSIDRKDKELKSYLRERLTNNL